MVAAVNPLHEAETLSTLKYAQQYSSLQSNQEEINQLCRKSLKEGMRDTDWTRESLKARMLLGQREKPHVRSLFALLAELERAERKHSEHEEWLQETKSKSKQRDSALLIYD